MDTKHTRTVVACASMAACALTGLLAPRAEASQTGPQPPADAITRIADFANFFDAPGVDSPDIHTQLLADPVDKLFFAENDYLNSHSTSTCSPRMVSYGSDSLTQLHSACLPTFVQETTSRNGGSNGILGAVDPVDHLLFVTAGNHPPNHAPAVYVFDELSLTKVGEWVLPSGNPPTTLVAGLSWSSAHDELVVLADNDDGYNDLAAVSLSDIDIHAMLHGPPGATDPFNGGVDISSALRWQVPITSCAYGLATQYGTANAYLSADDRTAFVPCQLAGNLTSTFTSTQTLHQGSDGIVKIDLGTCGPTPQTTSCPTETTIAPSPVHDMVFDSVSDRAILTYATSSSFTLEVYDGLREPPSFIGSLDAQGGLSSSLAFDQQTGRVYAATTQRLTAIDLRRTPFAPGIRLDQYAGATFQKVLPVLPADPVHPYARFFIDYARGTSNLPAFAMFADTIPISHDPPSGDVDASTNGTLSSGLPVTRTYSGAASGFGVHSDDVGGVGAAVYNNIDGPDTGISVDQYRIIGGTRDLVAGWVKSMRLADGVSHGGATAFGDANGATQGDYSSCSEIGSPTECEPAPVNPPSAGVGSQNAQPWPFPDAVCDQPGAGRQTSTVTGIHTGSLTAGGSTIASSAQLGPIDAGPASGGTEVASVDCSTAPPDDGVLVGGSVSGTASSETLTTPIVAISSATSEGSVQPPTSDVGVTSTAVSEARGIQIQIAGHSLYIGDVQQRAVATAMGIGGSARATDHVSVNNLVLDGTELCVVCTPANIAEIDSTFPTTINIMQPLPDQPFGAATGDTLPGSPGGYESVVQADVLEQQGDRQFNAMSPSESVIHPALRVVLYENSNGETNREVLDLAGVSVDAEEGIQALELPAPPPPTPTNIIIEQQAAGYITTTTPGPPTYITRYVGHGGRGPSGIVAVVQQVMTGLQYLVRSPLQVLRMFIVLCVLGLPLFLMIRRRTWLAER